ncbi:NUDIX hydrolase [Tepidibacillus fermentans]|uniref:8-oxo-dGTP diphosphatase n=1 Tax=Tepidibacillus fermentans TaxID=1281767 RepID=A0A4R3KDD4_9BACI|nr:8-oxo-dGTP diphosphatase [Tepidibacillus fermentans]TCS81050.1 8-oxo-dGTP diphosphatase [Tepidibacillus fermentans]
MYKYNICFIKLENRILLINREQAPWMGRWNGIGGKLEKGETLKQSVIREVFEETGILLDDVVDKGTVTWEVDGVHKGGMYLFFAELPKDYLYQVPKKTEEGIIDWKEIAWVLDPENEGVASNIPFFLPKMLFDDKQYEHLCIFKGGQMVGYQAIEKTKDMAK